MRIHLKDVHSIYNIHCKVYLIGFGKHQSLYVLKSRGSELAYTLISHFICRCHSFKLNPQNFMVI